MHQRHSFLHDPTRSRGILTPHLFAGVDPGLSGAIALYDPKTQAITITDTPTLNVKVGKKQRRQVDLYALARWADLYGASIIKATIESVHTMPGQGVASSGAFMRAFGNVEMAIVSAFVATEYVSPQKWKKHFGLTADKDESRRAASRLLPRSAHLWARVKDDGRAEAALLALYGAHIAALQKGSLAA